MPMARVIFAAMALTAGGLMTMTSAEARHYRHSRAYSDFAVDAARSHHLPRSTSILKPIGSRFSGTMSTGMDRSWLVHWSPPARM
jgi:hypothetical protein